MVTQDDYFASLSEAQVFELERLYDQFQAAGRMDDGPAKDRLLQTIDKAAQGLDSAELMAASRTLLIVAAFERNAYAEMFELFVPTMDLVADRGDEISEHIRVPLETLVVGVLGTLVDDPTVSRATIEDFLGQLEKEAKSGRASGPNLALARAYWYSHTGERDAFDEWFDRWVTSGSTWWRPEMSRTINLTATMLGAFDPHEALDHLVRRVPTLVGDPEDHRKAAVSIAGWHAICGDPETAWQQCRGLLTDRDTPEVATLVDEVYGDLLLRACEAAPNTSDPREPDLAAIAAAVAAELDVDSTDVVEGAAALARHHLRRGDDAEGRRWRDLATERAAAFDRRNGTTQQSSLLATRWFHDL